LSLRSLHKCCQLGERGGCGLEGKFEALGTGQTFASSPPNHNFNGPSNSTSLIPGCDGEVAAGLASYPADEAHLFLAAPYGGGELIDEYNNAYLGEDLGFGEGFSVIPGPSYRCFAMAGIVPLINLFRYQSDLISGVAFPCWLYCPPPCSRLVSQLPANPHRKMVFPAWHSVSATACRQIHEWANTQLP
jgi:hypothetical protein